MSHAGKIIVYGGRGALGSSCITALKKLNFWVGCVDYHPNTEADFNVLVNESDTLKQQESYVLSSVKNNLNNDKLNAVICVAGGWAGDMIKNSEKLWRESVWSSLIAVSLARQNLDNNGLVTLTGARAALEGTPQMIGYGMVKSAVHHLVRSLGVDNNGLPPGSSVVGILPDTLDTPRNRKWMPNADFSNWTPLEFVANLMVDWIQNPIKPTNGSLMQLVTKNSVTNVIPVKVEPTESYDFTISQ